MSWSNVALSKLVDIKGGGTPSKANSEYWNGSIPWASVKDFKSTDLNGASDYITQEGIDNSATSLIPRGNLIVPTRMALGKVAINSVDIAINQDLKALIIKDESVVDTEYLFRCIQSKSEEIVRQGKGATVKGITVDVLKNLQIPVPPLETQKQIAAVLEKADQLRKDCQQMEQELNSLAQSVFIDMFVGKDFPLVNLEDLASNKKHALSSGPFGSALSSKHYTDEGVLVLRGLNTTKGKIDLSKTKYISQEKYEELKRSKLSVNDVVVVAVGSSGFAISIPDGFPEAVMSQNFNKISPDIDLIIPKYLEFAINSSFVQRQFSREITDTVRTFLSLTKLKKVQIPLPPLELQKEFLSTIKSILKEEELNQQLLSEMDNCFSSLMQKAFKGELNL